MSKYESPKTSHPESGQPPTRHSSPSSRQSAYGCGLEPKAQEPLDAEPSAEGRIAKLLERDKKR